MQPFLALITPLSDAGGGGNPPGIWGPTDPRPGYGLPGQGPDGRPPSGGGGGNGNHPSHPISGGGFPTHPIAPGGEHPAHPIAPGGWPPYPSHPIYFPDAKPEHPIEMPPDTPAFIWKSAWSPEVGWFIVGVPTGEHPAPSEK